MLPDAQLYYMPSIPVHWLLHLQSQATHPGKVAEKAADLLVTVTHVYMSVMGKMECCSSDSLGSLGNIISWLSCCNTLNHRSRPVQRHPRIKKNQKNKSFTMRNHVPLAMFWQIESPSFFQQSLLPNPLPVISMAQSTKLCFWCFVLRSSRCHVHLPAACRCITLLAGHALVVIRLVTYGDSPISMNLCPQVSDSLIFIIIDC